MPITVRVMVNEENVYTVHMQMSCNDKVADIISELSDFTTENKYKLSLIKD
jgi:hypothetical protein